MLGQNHKSQMKKKIANANHKKDFFIFIFYSKERVIPQIMESAGPI